MGLKVILYTNQFFGQLGSEEAADAPLEIREGAVGPALSIQKALGDLGSVVATVICGDNTAGEDIDALPDKVIDLIKGYEPDLFLAGPAFGAGRFGYACGAICAAVKEKLGIPAVTAMNEVNPGIDLYREKVYIIETGLNAREMPKVVEKMVKLALKLFNKEPIGSPAEEGYFPQGYIHNVFVGQSGAERGVRMLVDILNGKEVEPELELAHFNTVKPAPPVKDLKTAKIGLVTDGGLVPAGNPDGLEWGQATKYVIIDLKSLETLKTGDFYANHGGFDTREVNADPLRLVPLDIMQELEAAGEIGSLNKTLYSTTGCTTPVSSAERIGAGILEHLKQDDVDAVVLTSTWGTSTRCGATLAKLFEGAGIPCAHITSLPSIATMALSNRIIQANGIIHPVGDASLPTAEERKLRRSLVMKALKAITTEVETSLVIK